MKNTICILLISVLLINCSTKSTRLNFSPKKNRTYEIELNSVIVSMFFEIEMQFEKKANHIAIDSKIKNVLYKDGSDNEATMNSQYSRFINTVITSVFDTQGHRIDTSEGTNIFNIELLVAEFPNREIKEGDSWSGEKSAEPDFVFETIKTDYTCRTITETNTTMDVTMTFLEAKNSQTDDMKFSKAYTGYYIVDTNGVVESARFSITGFTGFSQLDGYLEITTKRD